MPDITVRTWNRYTTTHLCVSAELMGASHDFCFENHRVLVRLPRAEHADRDEGYDQVARLSSYRTTTNEPLTYTIHRVDVEVEVLGAVSIPDDALTKPPNQYESFSAEQRKTVEQLCESYPGRAERAFEYWLEILRWSSGLALIGQPQISGAQSGWGTYLIDTSTQHRVWACAIGLTVYAATEVTKEHWEVAAIHHC
jgi:hypothetical protein